MTPRTEYIVTITAHERAELLPVAPDPKPLAPEEIAGRTLVTLISPGTELSAAFQAKKFPTHCGYAAVFQVEQVGSEVKDVAVGDILFCPGRHRSFQRVDRKSAVPVPAGLAPAVAVFARLMGVSMTTLVTTKARPTETVLVTGLGLVGNLAAQLFAASGYDVIAVDPDRQRCELARRLGLQRVHESVPLNDAQVAGHVALAVECSGHEQAVLDACRVVRKGGEVVLVGVPWRRRTELTAHEILHAVFHKYVVLRSGWEWELPLHATDFRDHSIFGNYAGALRWLAEGRVRVNDLAVTLPPTQAQQAYEDLLRNRCRGLTVLFDWRSE